jgi:ABC-type sugar transport system ATPase subunit
MQSTFRELTILQNISISRLPHLVRFGLVSDKLETQLAERFTKSLSIKLSNLHDRITSLSGGNQQKAILARWLATDPKLLILDEPTHGIDVGAKEEIYHLIQDIAQRGIAIILVSSEMPEIIALSHRVVIMNEGRITGIFDGNDINQETLMSYATGVLDGIKN